MIITLLLFIR